MGIFNSRSLGSPNKLIPPTRPIALGSPPPEPKPLKPSTLKKKQTISHEEFLVAWRNVRSIVTKDEIDRLVERTIEEIRFYAKGKKVAYSWSGGKDSIALEYVCRQAGIDLCLHGMSNLEYPAFLQWITDHMPPGLSVINTGQDLQWLKNHPDMLFPQTNKECGRWFKIVQHTAQAQFYHREKIDVLLLGRRLQDGNYCGEGGIYTTNEGTTRYSPLRHWRHEDIFAILNYYRLDIPPIYDWPRGFRAGTCPWPARMWTGSVENGWKETWIIDENIVREAAEVLPSAADFMKRHGYT